MSDVKLFNGDCLIEMQKLIDKDITVDLICTDPPYNVSKLNDNRDRSKMDSPVMRRKKPLNYDFGDWDNMERQEFLQFTKDWYKLCVDLLRDGGTLISFFSKEDANYLGWMGKDYGIRTRTYLTWHKTNPVPSFRKVNYLSACEYIFIGSKGETAWTFNFKQQKEMHNFFETPNQSSYGVTKHPTEKPVTLIKHLLEIHSNPNDTVLDCFMGSGTTGVACQELNRNFIGIELDKEYFKIAEQRIKEAKAQRRLI
jgi:DNA modification methylase